MIGLTFGKGRQSYLKWIKFRGFRGLNSREIKTWEEIQEKRALKRPFFVALADREIKSTQNFPGRN